MLYISLGVCAVPHIVASEQFYEAKSPGVGAKVEINSKIKYLLEGTYITQIIMLIYNYGNYLQHV